MNSCIQYTLKCLSDGLGVFINIPTTTTTLDPLCYLVDCKGNFIVDCECNYIGCACPSSPIITTSTTTTTAFITTSTTTTSVSPTTTTSSTTSTTTTQIAPTTTSTTTTNGGGGSSTTTTSTSSTTTTISPSSKLTVPVGANLVSFGDSITTINYVPGGLSNLYTTLLANDLGIGSARYAQGSTGFKSLMKFVHQGCSGVGCQTLNPAMTPNTNVVTELYGLNNVYYEGSKTNKLEIVKHGCYTLMSVQWASSIINGANSAITRTGTFSTYLAKNSVFCGRFGTSPGNPIPNTQDGVYSNVPGSYAEYTATFRHVIIGLMGGNGQFATYPDGTPIPSGVVNIYVNNVLQTTINLGQQYPSPYAGANDGFASDVETLGPVMVPIIMPSSASRTIKIELVSGNMAIDYISVLANPASCYPLILSEIPYVNPAQWGTGSQVIADTYSSQKQTIVNTWAAQGFPIRYNVLNAPAGPYNYVNTTDGTHPDILGNQQVKTAFRSLFV